MENFVGHGNAIHLTTKYDAKEVILLLMTIFDPLNPTIVVFVAPCDGLIVQVEKEDDNMFGVINSMQESSWAFVAIDFSLFERLSILHSMLVNPLALWQTCKGQFLNVGFLAKQIFGIPKSSIETKIMFSLDGVLTALRHYCLQVESLD